jgi:predicted RNase H-like nuclease (RuvC/YqgF family)
MSKPKPTKHEDDVRRGLRTAQYNGIIDTQLKVIEELKAEVESLKKPAVIGGYNISEYIRMANSETLEFDNGDIFADMTLPERIKYIVESHARLKAEVERLTRKLEVADNHAQCLEMVINAGTAKELRLKAEVERLTNNCDYLDKKLDEELDKSAMLCGQVERLTKAGDAMAEEMGLETYAEEHFKQQKEFLKAWNAAKEGKKP